MLFFAVVVAASGFAADGSKTNLRISQNVVPNSRNHQATLVQQPAMFTSEIPKGPVAVRGLAGNTGSYPDEVTSVDAEAEPPSAVESSHEDSTEDSEPPRSITDGSGPEPPKQTTQETDFTGERAYDNDADDGDADDYLQGAPSNQTEVLTMQDELALGVTPAPPPEDESAEKIDLPFVIYPGFAKLEKQKLERRKLAKQKREEQKLEANATVQPAHLNQTKPNQTLQQPQQADQKQMQSPQLVKSLTATGTSHMLKATGSAVARSAAPLPTGPPQPGWGQPVGILRPKGWESCLKFAKYTKDEGYKGVALVRVWKSLCEPSMLAGSATERYRLMCVSLGKAVEKYAVQPEWSEEDICDSVLATFHDIAAVDTPFDR